VGAVGTSSAIEPHALPLAPSRGEGESHLAAALRSETCRYGTAGHCGGVSPPGGR